MSGPSGHIGAIAALSGRTHDELYRLFRLEGAPKSVGHVGGCLVYDLDECVRWLNAPEAPSSIAETPGSEKSGSQPPCSPETDV